MERVFSVDGKRLVVLGQLTLDVFSHESGYGLLAGGTRSSRVPAAYVLKEANSY